MFGAILGEKYHEGNYPGGIILECNYMRANYPGGNIPRDNYPGGNFRGSNCPVTQRNRQVWEKIKHKKILVKNICLGCCSEYKIIPWVMLFEWTNICNILNIIFEKRYLENPPGCNLKNNRVYELFRRSISSENEKSEPFHM